MNIYGMDIRGKFWIPRVSSITDHPWMVGDEGRILYGEESQKVFYGGNTEWKEVTGAKSLFAENSEIIFGSTPLPTGWNIKTIDALGPTIVTTTDTDEVGDLEGTWFITGMVADGDHNHFAPDASATPSAFDGRGTSELYDYVPGNSHIHDIYASGTHVHTFLGSWRPPYRIFGIGVWSG